MIRCQDKVATSIDRALRNKCVVVTLMLFACVGPLWVVVPIKGSKYNYEQRQQNNEALWLDKTTPTYKTYSKYGLGKERMLRILIGSLTKPADVNASVELLSCLRQLPTTSTSVVGGQVVHPILDAWLMGGAPGMCVSNIGLNVSDTERFAQILYFPIGFEDTERGRAWETAAVSNCVEALDNALWMTSNSLVDEYSQLVIQDVHLFVIALISQALILCLVFGIGSSILSLAVISIIAVAVVSAFGWVILCTNFNVVFFILLFVLISVGVDDAILFNGIASGVAPPFDASDEHKAYTTTVVLSAVTSMGTFAIGLTTPMDGLQQVSAFGLVSFGMLAILMYNVYTRCHIGWKSSTTRCIVECRRQTCSVERWMCWKPVICLQRWYESPTFHVMVIVAYVILTIVSGTMIPRLNTDTDVTKLLPDDSNVRQFLERAQDITSNGHPFETIEWFTSDANGTRMSEWINENPHLTLLCPTMSRPWVGGWRHSTSAIVKATSEQIWNDVVLDGNRVLKGGVWSKMMMYSETGANMTTYSLYSMLYSLGILGLVIWFFLPWRTTLLLVVLVATIDVNLLGWMVWLGISLDFFALLCIVIALGVSVDFAVHVAMASYEYRRKNRTVCCCRGLAVNKELLWYIMKGRGKDMLISITSTFVGIGVLGFASSEVFRSFFQLVAGIFLCGLISGGAVLPAILCLVIRSGCAPRANQELVCGTVHRQRIKFNHCA